MSEIEYNYRTIDEIIKALHSYSDFWILDLLILLIISAFIVGTVLYLVPGWKAMRKLRKSQSERDKKKLALKQILIQKEVEQEIENELKLEAEQKIWK